MLLGGACLIVGVCLYLLLNFNPQNIAPGTGIDWSTPQQADFNFFFPLAIAAIGSWIFWTLLPTLRNRDKQEGLLGAVATPLVYLVGYLIVYWGVFFMLGMFLAFGG